MACLPPSTGNVAPVMKEAASEAKKAIALATSMASPGLPKACVVLLCSKKAVYLASSIPERLCNSVTVTPGLKVDGKMKISRDDFNLIKIILKILTKVIVKNKNEEIVCKENNSYQP